MAKDDFLLTTELAKELYRGVACRLPIIDFHCHLDAGLLSDNRPFENLARLWVIGDPYKHRIMRIAGIDERRITGDASDQEKFLAWAEVCPRTIGGPLFDWSRMELAAVFGVEELLTKKSAERIWGRCNERLAEANFLPQALLDRFNVEMLCTSNGIDEDLSPHHRLRELHRSGALGARVIPSPRDGAPFDDDALDRFHCAGCRIADHSVEEAGQLDELLPLARAYAERGWVLQLHLGAERHTNSRLRERLGPAGGYASMGRSFDTTRLIRFCDTLDREGNLPRTLIFPLNPVDTASLSTLTGAFAPQLKMGPAWWYNDHRLGMVEHLENLGAYSLLSSFIGMTTDSRSLLSMVRHDYFRRILCAWVGEQAERDLLPRELPLLKDLIRRLSYDNAKKTFMEEK